MLDLGPIVGRVAELGYLGVTFFFVLSGFVLAWSAGEMAVQPWAFYQRRFARVYPLHLATTLVAGAAILATGGTVAATYWILCLLLVQAWVPSSTTYFALNPVSWSLACEAFFYALTPFLLRWAVQRSTRACVAAAAILCTFMAVIALIVLTYAPERDQDVWFSPWYSLGTFTAGITLALAIRRGATRFPSLPAAAAGVLGTVMLLITLSWNGGIGRTAATVLTLPAVLALIAAAAQRDLSGRDGWLRHRWMVRLGQWSFALYLIHKIIFKIVAEELPHASGPILTGMAVTVAIIASGVVYHCYERPLENLLRPGRTATGPNNPA